MGSNTLLYLTITEVKHLYLYLISIFDVFDSNTSQILFSLYLYLVFDFI